MNVPDIAEKISDLYNAIKNTCASPTDIADKINSILIYGDGVPTNLLDAAWDQFARQKGVKNGQ